MPRVSLKKYEYKMNDFSKWVRVQMLIHNKKQEDMANLLGISRSGFTYKINHNAFTLEDIMKMTVSCFCREDVRMAMHVEPLEEVIDTLSKKVKENHIKRLQKGKCTIEMGFILEDVLTCLERVSDHCSNVAVEMITIVENEYNTHEYFNNFSEEKRKEFHMEYEQLIKKYLPPASP